MRFDRHDDGDIAQYLKHNYVYEVSVPSLHEAVERLQNLNFDVLSPEDSDAGSDADQKPMAED